MIAQRPLVDFEAGYFKDCYESEIRTKKKIAKIIRILKASQVFDCNYKLSNQVRWNMKQERIITLVM